VFWKTSEKRLLEHFPETIFQDPKQKYTQNSKLHNVVLGVYRTLFPKLAPNTLNRAHL
jgi:hypothetical protein